MSMEIHQTNPPSKTEVNVREGIYTAVVALVSLLTFSTVISFMTSLIGTLQHKRMEEKLGLDSSFWCIITIP